MGWLIDIWPPMDGWLIKLERKRYGEFLVFSSHSPSSFLNSPTHLRNVRDCMLLHRRKKPAPLQILRARTADLLKVPALAAHPLLGLFYVGFVGPLVDLKSLIFLTKQFVPVEQVYSNYRGCGRSTVQQEFIAQLPSAFCDGFARGHLTPERSPQPCKPRQTVRM